MKYKIGDLVEIYHNELEEFILYKIIREDGKYKGIRYPRRMAEDGNIEWLEDRGSIR